MSKYTLTFKDPDYAVQGNGYDIKGLPQTAVALRDTFVEWDEYVTIELDTETKTARVVPVSTK